MCHSIIIPHRNRHGRLAHCLRSITRSARVTGIKNYEVYVIDLNSKWPPWNCIYPIQITADPISTPDGGFNKCHALNHGLQVARGSTITFLDADAIVGTRWLEGVRHLDEDPSLIRLCYRVRLLNQDQERQLNEAAQQGRWEQHVDKAFRKFNLRQDEGGLDPAWEAYYQVNLNWFKDPKTRRPIPPDCGSHVFGNSQFSMRRDDIGELRFDEENFPRAGHEDLDFIQQVRHKFRDRYKAKILTDAEHGMLHIQSPGEPDWNNPDTAREQKRRYLAKWSGT